MFLTTRTMAVVAVLLTSSWAAGRALGRAPAGAIEYEWDFFLEAASQRYEEHTDDGSFDGRWDAASWRLGMRVGKEDFRELQFSMVLALMLATESSGHVEENGGSYHDQLSLAAFDLEGYLGYGASVHPDFGLAPTFGFLYRYLSLNRDLESGASYSQYVRAVALLVGVRAAVAPAKMAEFEGGFQFGPLFGETTWSDAPPEVGWTGGRGLFYRLVLGARFRMERNFWLSPALFYEVQEINGSRDVGGWEWEDNRLTRFGGHLGVIFIF